MATHCQHTYRGANIILTEQQRQLLVLVEWHTRHGQPAVQRDWAERLGIRRDSLNKLLARTRRALAAHGVELELPVRHRQAAVSLFALSDD